MEDNQLFPRLKDLCRRCISKNIPTNTFFLTPREQIEAQNYARAELELTPVFFGGYEDAERKIAFFLPDYIEPSAESLSDSLRAVCAVSPFASLSHRDYLGALMNIGIERECIGDILFFDGKCYFFLTPAVAPHVLSSLVRVGREGVSLTEVPLNSLPSFVKDVKEITFTVQSMRADAVIAGIFRISRSLCQDLFPKGDISINYFPCMDRDFPVSEGDILSLRHHGKAKILKADGRSRKGRIFVTAGIYC